MGNTSNKQLKEDHKQLREYLTKNSVHVSSASKDKTSYIKQNISNTPIENVHQIVLSNFSYDGWKLFIPFKVTLKSLGINSIYPSLTSDSAMVIARTLPGLETLMLRGHSIGDHGAKRIVLNLKYLNILDLSQNKLTSKGKSVVRNRCRQKLEYLFV